MMSLIRIEWFYVPCSKEKVTVNLVEDLGQIGLRNVPLNTFHSFIADMSLSPADFSMLEDEICGLEDYISSGEDEHIPGKIEWLNHRFSIVVGDLSDLINTLNTADLYVYSTVANAYRQCESVFKAQMDKWRVNARTHPKKIWFNPPYTTVEFFDGEKVTVRAEDGTAYSKFGGFAACILKKRYGSTTEAIHVMEECEQAAKEASPSYIRQQRLEKRKIERRKRHELKVAKREAAIKAKQDELRILWEAEKRLEQERLKKGE